MTRDAEFVAFSSGQNTSSRRAADLAMDRERAMISKPNNCGHPRRERRRSCRATRYARQARLLIRRLSLRGAANVVRLQELVVQIAFRPYNLEQSRACVRYIHRLARQLVPNVV
jgi:hypothetical protein